jgi:DNA-binding NtrC family response regulator
MPTYRCAIIRLDATPETVEPLEAALRDMPEFEHMGQEEAALEQVRPHAIVLVATRSGLPVLLDRVSQLRRDRPACVILVTGAAFDAEQLTALLKAGADDFVHVPARADEFAVRLRRALSLAPPPQLRDAFKASMRDFIGRSPVFVRQVAKLPMIAGSDAGVLILGETGTGKEVCAQAIHYQSARGSKPWIAVNCGAIPLDLIESELFGHVRGAYTTANTSREGLVSEAEGGTLFLDDIDCLPVSAQAKLLRFLQEHEYRAVGANAVKLADVRVIAASNRDLAGIATKGEFRQDLYFRLNVLTLVLPPLRERREDIAELAMHFVDQFSRKSGRHPPSLTPQALSCLLAHDWPGNVRELQNVIERSLLMAQGPHLSAEDVDIRGTAEVSRHRESFRIAKGRVVQQFERAYIEHLLTVCEGNVTHAAHEAKKNRRAFFELIRKHRIEPDRYRPTR